MSSSEKRMEIITVAILAFAVVDGVERIPGVVVGRHPIELLQPSRRLTHECSPATDCGQPIPLLADLSVFENYIDAVILERPEVADFYLQRFRDEFKAGLRRMDGSRPAQQPRRPAKPVCHARVPTIPGGRGRPSRGPSR